MPQTSSNSIKYVYDLPYSERMELCRILDTNDKWETLAGQYMNFDMMTIQVLRREIRCGRSPTDELLTRWGHQNHTILELFVHLSKMQHYQAMLAIKSFIDVEYHRLIYEGEANLSQFFKRPTAPPQSSNNNVTKSVASVNFNCSDSSNVLACKMAGISLQSSDGESKVLNLMVPEPPEGNSPNSGCEAPTALVNNNNGDNRHSPSFRGEPSRMKERSEGSIGVEPGGPPMIPFKELEIATNGWDPAAILGKGGFGTVYKGAWKNTSVAVKRTRATVTDENQTVQIQQILGELRMLNAYRHDNVLPLYGYSMGGEDPCLIYQFMPNGSLEDRLLCRQGTPPLTWLQRLTIAVGTARGLQFLHTINEKPLIHGDIKSANILLDSNFQPKIGDFGLAREGPHNHYTHMKVSRVHGTRPYLPDEFLRAKKFSTKVDTHSFGIVLFELCTGLRAYDDQRNHKFLRDLVENTTDSQILIDRKPPPEDPLTFRSLIDLGKVCVSRKPKDRPEMVLVLQELEAIAAQRELKLRAQLLVDRNNLTPVSPYELQLLHDHLSQQRNNNISPGPDCRKSPRLSPIPDNRQNVQMMPAFPDGRTISPSSDIVRVVSPLPETTSINRVSPSPDYQLKEPQVGSIPYALHGNIVIPQIPLVPGPVSPQPGKVFPNNLLSDQNGGRNFSPQYFHQIPICVPQMAQPAQCLPTVLRKSPVISVSPPSANESSIVQSDDTSNELSAPTVLEEGPPELSFDDSQYSHVIPLLSELGIKKATAQVSETPNGNSMGPSSTWGTPNVDSAEPSSIQGTQNVDSVGPSSIMETPNVDREPVTAKGKSLCFFTSSG